MLLKFFFTTTVLFYSSLPAKTIERIRAIVNGQIISQQDIEKFKSSAKSNKLQDDLFSVDYSKLVKSEEALLDHLINQKIVDAEAIKLGLSPSDERVEEELSQIAASNSISKTQLIRKLKNDGIIIEEYKNFIKKRLERQRLIQREITAKIRISDDELKSFYSNNAPSNSKADIFEYKISHILFFKKQDSKAAKERATRVLSELDQGKSFEKLASQYSEDPNFSNGGFLGTFKSGEFLPQLEVAVKSLSTGSFSQLVDLADKYLILKLNAKVVVDSPAFIANKEQIRAHLQQEAFKKQFQFWLTQKRSESNIRIN